MPTKHFENGIVAAESGASTDIETDIFVTGDIFWVNSTGGNDANDGKNRNLPKATLASAISAATADNGDIIILESGHAETLSTAITVSKAGLLICGLGTGSSKPAFTVDAAIDGFDLTGVRGELNNIRFPVGTTTPNTSRINPNAAGWRILNCDFLCGANDLETITVPNAADDLEINGCTFTISADGPDAGIEIEDATVLGLKVINCSFDGGSYDFDAGAINSVVAHLNYLYRDNTLLNKASIIHTAAAKGFCIGTIAGDGSRVQV